MLRYGIPSYKLEKDLLAAEIDVIRELGVEIRCGVEIGKDITIEELREQGYKGFYVAIGCSVEENRVSQERMQKVLMQPLISCGKRERKKALRLKVMLWLSAVVM